MKKILIVDDNKDMREFCKKMLLRWKKQFIVETVQSAEEALQILDNTFSLVIMDLNMPRFDGLWLAKQIKDKFNEKIVVIIMTIFISKEKIAEGRNLGVSDFLLKPFKINRLFSIISHHLK